MFCLLFRYWPMRQRSSNNSSSCTASASTGRRCLRTPGAQEEVGRRASAETMPSSDQQAPSRNLRRPTKSPSFLASRETSLWLKQAAMGLSKSTPFSTRYSVRHSAIGSHSNFHMMTHVVSYPRCEWHFAAPKSTRTSSVAWSCSTRRSSAETSWSN